MRTIKRIFIHCTASYQETYKDENLVREFKRKGWRYPGYHYVIRPDGTIFNMGLNRPNFVADILFLVLLYGVSRYEENGGSGRDWIAQRQIVARWAIYYGLLFTILIFGIYGPGYNASDFVYMKF